MEKKLSTGKVAGIIFCILAGICTVVLLFLNGYYSGQMKVIDKCYTSIARGDFNGFKSCLSVEYAEKFAEADFEDEVKKFQNMINSEEIKIDVTFAGRGKWIDDGPYAVFFDFTVYNDENHVTKQTWMFLQRYGMKWVIDDYDLWQ